MSKLKYGCKDINEKAPLVKFRDIGQNVLMANPNQQMFYSPYGDHSIQ